MSIETSFDDRSPVSSSDSIFEMTESNKVPPNLKFERCAPRYMPILARVGQKPSRSQEPRILIAHPGRQHSHQAALALLEAGMLGCYATGVPVSRQQLGRPWNGLVRQLSVYEEIDIPLHLTRLNMVAPVVNRLLARYLPTFVVGPIQYETERVFDRWVAGLVARDQFDGVIAYENSALYTFQAAKKIGARCILDAASLHRAEADRRYDSGLPSIYKTRVDSLKDREVALADCILATSDLAADSYRTNIGPEKSVKTVCLGVDTTRFHPSSELKISSMPDELFTFAFVGAGTIRKGFDFILDAMEKLLSEGLSFRLSVAGIIDQSLLSGRERLLNNITEHGMVSHHDLPSVLNAAQCLLLPSRFDSFGLVIPEALACGVPVIVSDMVGAKQLIQEGGNGFIVPVGDHESLEQRMRWCIAHPGLLRRMSIEARAAAEQLSWGAYRQRLTAAIREIL